MILVPRHWQHVEIEIGIQTSLQPYDSIDIVVARVANTLSRLLYSSLSFSGCLVATWIAKRLLPSKVMRWFLGGELVGGRKCPGGKVTGDTVFTADLACGFCNDRCNCLNQIYQGSSNLKTHNCSNKVRVFFLETRESIRYHLYQNSIARVSNIPVMALFRDFWNLDSLVYTALVKRKINYIEIKQSIYLAIVAARTAIPHRKSNHCGILSLQGEVMISFFP